MALRDAWRVLPEGGPEQDRICQGNKEALQVLAVHEDVMAVEARLTP